MVASTFPCQNAPKAMTCYICKTMERDLNDVVRTLRKRIAAQVDARAAARAILDLEVQALSKAKSEIEARYLKHQTTCCAVNSVEHSYEPVALAS